MSVYVWTDQDAAATEGDALTDRAVEIRETLGVSWETACIRAEQERDALDECDEPSDWDSGSILFDPYV